MPATDLRALREYVANVLDYDPTNPTYQTQVDRLLNEADRRICTEKLYTFAQVVADVELYADKSVTGVVIGAGGSITAPLSSRATPKAPETSEFTASRT